MRILCTLLLATAAFTVHAESGQRIIALGGSITETVFALDEGGRVVGVDSTSQYPAAARALPDVGYLRTLGAEGILSLQPDMVIASHEAGPPQVLSQLRGAGVRVEIIHTGPTAEHALIAMESVGALLGKADAGRSLAQANRVQLESLHSQYAGQQRPPRVLFVLGGHGAQPTIGGNDTKAATMIELAMGENVATGFSSYRPGSPEALLGMQPEVIVAASHGIEQIGGVEQLVKDSALALTPAGRDGRVVVMDSALLLGMGPRLGEAAVELAARIRGRLPDRTAGAGQ